MTKTIVWIAVLVCLIVLAEGQVGQNMTSSDTGLPPQEGSSSQGTVLAAPGGEGGRRGTDSFDDFNGMRGKRGSSPLQGFNGMRGKRGSMRLKGFNGMRGRRGGSPLRGFNRMRGFSPMRGKRPEAPFTVSSLLNQKYSNMPLVPRLVCQVS